MALEKGRSPQKTFQENRHSDLRQVVAPFERKNRQQDKSRKFCVHVECEENFNLRKNFDESTISINICRRYLCIKLQYLNHINDIRVFITTVDYLSLSKAPFNTL